MVVDDGTDTTGASKPGVCGQVADTWHLVSSLSPWKVNLTGVGCDDACEEAKERGLTRAIGSDERTDVAGL